MKANKNQPFYIASGVIFIALKYRFSIAGTDDLYFLLNPINSIVGFLTGLRSSYLPGLGFFYPQLDMVIDKSCSGFNFWLLCFLMLTVLSLKYFYAPKHKVLAILASFAGAYFLTIMVNSSRIFASIIIQGKHFSMFPYQNVMHETIGIVTNLSFLILIYLTVEQLLKNMRSYAKPT